MECLGTVCFPIGHCTGHCTGTVWALYGHCGLPKEAFLAVRVPEDGALGVRWGWIAATYTDLRQFFTGRVFIFKTAAESKAQTTIR